MRPPPRSARRAPAGRRRGLPPARSRRRASSLIAAASPSTSSGGDDAARAVGAHRLGEAADVVDHRRHAGAERAEQRAALVELRAVGEDGDGRLAERPVDLRLGEETRRRAGDAQAAPRRHARDRVARDARAACTGARGRVRARCARRPRAPGRWGRRGGGSRGASPPGRRTRPASRGRAREWTTIRSKRSKARRQRPVFAAVRRGRRSCAVNTSGARCRRSHESSSGTASHCTWTTSAGVAARRASPSGCSSTFSGTRSRERPKRRDESG